MGNFKDFDLELNKVKSSDTQSERYTVLSCPFVCIVTPNYCHSIAFPCDTILSCGYSCNKPSCDCTPSDMTACDVCRNNK